MKKKTINSIICKKFDEFSNSIDDENVKKLVCENSIITGGCIASMLLNEKVNDFDIYFTNKQTTKAVAEYYVKYWNDTNSDNGYVLDGADDEVNKGGAALNMTNDRIKIIFDSKGVAKEAGSMQDEDEQVDSIEENNQLNGEKYRPIYISGNAITLADKIQIVIRFYGKADEIHQHYDYVHCTNYWTSSDRKLVLNQKALESLLEKQLIYVGSKYPICSVIRTRKFIKRGWTVNAGQFLKMAFQISKLDLSNINVLEDQLVGVDVAYFSMLIEALKTKQDSDKNFSIEYGYIAEIIDRLF